MSGDVNAAAETILRDYLGHRGNFGYSEAHRALDALVAEVERLRAGHIESERQLREWQERAAEAEQLRAERDAAQEVIDAAQAFLASDDETQAHARLNAALDAVSGEQGATDRVIRFHAERAKRAESESAALRVEKQQQLEALREIAEHDLRVDYADTVLRNIARAALAATDPEVQEEA